MCGMFVLAMIKVELYEKIYKAEELAEFLMQKRHAMPGVRQKRHSMTGEMS